MQSTFFPHSYATRIFTSNACELAHDLYGLYRYRFLVLIGYPAVAAGSRHPVATDCGRSPESLHWGLQLPGGLHSKARSWANVKSSDANSLRGFSTYRTTAPVQVLFCKTRGAVDVRLSGHSLYSVSGASKYPARECLPPRSYICSKPCCFERDIQPESKSWRVTSPSRRETWCSSGPEPARTGKRVCSWSARSAQMARSAARSYGRTVPDAQRLGTPTGRLQSPGLAVLRFPSLDAISDVGLIARRVRSCLRNARLPGEKQGVGKKRWVDYTLWEVARSTPITHITQACRSP